LNVIQYIFIGNKIAFVKKFGNLKAAEINEERGDGQDNGAEGIEDDACASGLQHIIGERRTYIMILWKDEKNRSTRSIQMQRQTTI
jgi:hypothetical protein